LNKDHSGAGNYSVNDQEAIAKKHLAKVIDLKGQYFETIL